VLKHNNKQNICCDKKKNKINENRNKKVKQKSIDATQKKKRITQNK
jgi:hypothetical protein